MEDTPIPSFQQHNVLPYAGPQLARPMAQMAISETRGFVVAMLSTICVLYAVRLLGGGMASVVRYYDQRYIRQASQYIACAVLLIGTAVGVVALMTAWHMERRGRARFLVIGVIAGCWPMLVLWVRTHDFLFG